MLTIALALALTPKIPLSLHGVFVEACSCSATCGYEVTGADTKCNVMGAYQISRGSFDGKDVSGINMAYVITQPGNLLYLYAECPQSKTDLTKRLVFTLFGPYGKSQGLQRATIRIAKTQKMPGHYSMSINNGQTASLEITPVMGGDGKTPVVLNNVYGDPYDQLWQAKTIDGSFNGSGHAFLLKDTNAYYIPDMNIEKKI